MLTPGAQEWYRVTLASIGDAVITTDTQGLITFLNPVAESLTGWMLTDAVGQPLESVFKIINQDTRHTVESPTVRALRDGVIVGLANHTLLIAKDGTEYPIDDSAAPIRNDHNEVTGVVLVFRDITERYRQERHLQDARTYSDNIIATLREPFVVLDKDLRVKSANSSFYHNFRVMPHETEGRFLFDLGNGQWNIPALRSMLKEVSADHHPVVDFEIKQDFPAIGTRDMLLNARRLQFVDSQPDTILLAIEDITERKKAQAALEVSEVLYRRLFEAAKDGILMLNADTLKIIDANPFMTELLGYTHDEFMGKELWELGFFGDREASQSVYREMQEKGYVRYDHLPLATKHGKQAEVEFVSNIYQVDHRLVAQCNIRDISERSRLERKMKEQAEALADLHRRKDEFLAMLSHELRNPLAPILNAVQLLRFEKNESSLQQQARTVIERQAMQLARLVDDLLEVSRIATGRIRLNSEWVLLNGIVENAIETTLPQIEQRGHSLNTSMSQHPIFVNGDALRLEQVVVNLLTNAAKYTNDAGTIWISLQQDGDEAVIRVRDTGVGIDPELLPRIFELFTQADRSLARSQGGLGIGLSLVQRLVEMHCGRVEAYSSVGRGSEFVVRLPVALSLEPSQPVSTDAQPANPAASSLRVLVVDDNVDAAQTLALLLTKSGHDVRKAYNGLTALDEASNYRPDVVLLDIGLPGLNGFEVAKRLRQQPEFVDVVLIAMTGYAQEVDLQRSTEAGFNHHLVKPVNFDAVLRILAKIDK